MAKWQTRQTQNLLSERKWGFESPLRHLKTPGLSENGEMPKRDCVPSGARKLHPTLPDESTPESSAISASFHSQPTPSPTPVIEDELVTYRLETAHRAVPGFEHLARWAKRPDLGVNATLASARAAYRSMIRHRMRGTNMDDRIIDSTGKVYSTSLRHCS